MADPDELKFIDIVQSELMDVEANGNNILFNEQFFQYLPVPKGPYKFMVINSIIEFFESEGDEDAI